jgi:carbonic anhydrase
MHKLISGIVEFREQNLPKHAERFRELALAQAPDTFMVTCSDSRVVPDLLASTDPGELFVMRNVGNLIPPATAEGISIGDLSETSAIEYAVLVLKVANIVVCGHSECGAMKAAMARNPRPDAPNLEKWLHHASTAAFRLEHEGGLDSTLQPR